MVRRILVGLDGSEAGRHAARFAADLARGTDAHIIVVHVWHPTSAELRGMRSLERADIERFTEPYFEGLGLEASRFEHVVRMGDPAAEIVDAAHKHDADLIVLGRRSESPAGVTIEVIERSDLPVTVVH